MSKSKEVFAKLFDLEETQALVFIDETEEGDLALKVMMEVEGFRLTVILSSGKWDEEDARAELARIDEDFVDSLFSRVRFDLVTEGLV